MTLLIIQGLQKTTFITKRLKCDIRISRYGTERKVDVNIIYTIDP